MTRPLLLSLLLPLTLSLGCPNAADLSEKSTSAQAEAAQKATDARKQADAASADARNEANATSAEARKEAAVETRNAQESADKTTQSAEAAFATMREAYRHETTIQLAELDQKTAALHVRAKNADSKVRRDLETHIKAIEANRAIFVKDYEALDNTSGATWDDTKVRLAREWAEIERHVSEAS